MTPTLAPTLLSALLGVVAAPGLLAPGLLAQTTTRVSVTEAGAEVFAGNSENPTLSHTGRFIAFHSNAPGLVPGDTGNKLDVFVRDRALGTLERVSLSSAGVIPNAHCDFPSISADGRYVVFRSSANNLDPVDDDVAQDIYLHDRHAGTTTLMSKASDGSAVSFGHSSYPEISADGVYVAFESQNIKLVSDDSNGMVDIFVHNRITGITERVNLMNVSPPPPNVNQATAHSYYASISGDGRYVAFASEALNLVTADTNGRMDVFVRDRLLNTTKRISVSSAGVQGDDNSSLPALSADGTVIAFESTASNLVAGDTNGTNDVFVHHLATGVTERVSVSSAGVQGNLFSQNADVSHDGRYVTFNSGASNLVAGDTNGEGDIFVHDRVTHVTTLASLSTAGLQGDDTSQVPAISGDGRVVGWESTAPTRWAVRRPRSSSASRARRCRSRAAPSTSARCSSR
jgi:Tol biopolymer transport system component